MSEARAALDARMMARAVRAAVRGRPSPQPRAGAVVAQGAQIVGLGHKARSDSPAAELVALGAAATRARGATLYVTSEPNDAAPIVAAGIRRVVIGWPGELGGAKAGSSRRLQRRGLEVVRGVLVQRVEELLSGALKHARTGTPEVTLKAAVTLDGRSAERSGVSKWITGELARREVHRMRAQADAVLVGVGTVLADDPELTVRAVRGPNPLRVVLDSQLRTPAGAKLVRTAGQCPTLVFHTRQAPERRRRQLTAAGVQLVEIARGARRSGVCLRAVLRELGRRNVQSVLVEGGAGVHGALLDAGLVDRVAVFIAPCLLGDARALPLAAGHEPRPLSAAWRIAQPQIVRFGDDVLVRGRVAVPQSPNPPPTAAPARGLRARRSRRRAAGSGDAEQRRMARGAPSAAQPDSRRAGRVRA